MLVSCKGSGEGGMLLWWMGIPCPSEVRKHGFELLLLD